MFYLFLCHRKPQSQSKVKGQHNVKQIDQLCLPQSHCIIKTLKVTVEITLPQTLVETFLLSSSINNITNNIILMQNNGSKSRVHNGWRVFINSSKIQGQSGWICQNKKAGTYYYSHANSSLKLLYRVIMLLSLPAWLENCIV